MKHYSVIIFFFLSQICCLGQQKDIINQQHLVLKFSPFTYLGTHAAIQFGLETNLTQKMSVGFDYAYGNSDLASYQKGGSYYDGEVSRRYRLDLRWYENQFASSNLGRNSFWGVELFNRTNTYNTPIVVGKGHCQTVVTIITSEHHQKQPIKSGEFMESMGKFMR